MLRFIINNFDLLAEEITLIYKKRWQIELISSHASRRYFIGNLFNNVQDPNLISSMSGHVNGSKSFERYRTINKTIKQNLVNLLCK